jgi:hypothetical protein
MESRLERKTGRKEKRREGRYTSGSVPAFPHSRKTWCYNNLLKNKAANLQLQNCEFSAE